MSGKETFKIFLISVIFSLALLVFLPQIPLNINSDLWILNSNVGGLQIKVPGSADGKVLDLNEFKKGSGIGESKKVTFQLSDKELQNKQEVLSSIALVTKKRLNLAGISDFQVNIEGEDALSVVIPQYEDSDRVVRLVSGNGKLVFRKVKNRDDWNPDQFQNFYLEADRWEDIDIKESDVLGFFRVLDQTTGGYRMQIAFTDEGRAKFYKFAAENIGLPLAVYVSDFNYPFLMPMIGENILENTSTDPAVTTPYAQQVIDDYNLQLKNPLSSDLTSLETGVVEAKMGSDFITKYFYSFISGLFLISAFFMIKFGAKSIVFSFSLFLSVLVYLAVSKILSIPIGTPLISSLVLITGIISAIGNYIFSRFKTGLKEGKPFEVLYLQILKKDKEIISYPSIFVLFLSFLIMLATSGIAKSFAFAFLIGMLVVVLFYYFLLPTLMWAFRGKQK